MAMRLRQGRFAIVALTAAVAAAGAPAARGGEPLATAQVRHCVSGPYWTDRRATFVGSMRTVDGAAHLQMRFHVGSVLTPWRTSDPGVDRFTYRQIVAGLASGPYQAVVKFRWLDGAGQVIRRAKRTSDDCQQPPIRVNLTIAKIAIAPGDAVGTSIYRVSVLNSGDVPLKKPFMVSLYTNQDYLVDSRKLKRIGAGQTRVVKFAGPSCQTVTAWVDQDERVAETDAHDNSLKQTC